jgi:hypothetical protein
MTQFLGLPQRVRNQIYAGILVPNGAPGTESFKSIDSSILLTNRQINSEGTNIFFATNLFVLIETNDPALTNHIDESEIAIFAKDPAKIKQCKKIGMKLDLHIFDGQLAPTSCPAFLITVAELPSLVKQF